MSNQWFYTQDKKTKVGPFSWDQLKALGQAGQIDKGDMVLNPETSKWVPASSLESLFPVQAAAQVAVAEAPHTAEPLSGDGKGIRSLTRRSKKAERNQVRNDAGIS